MRMNFTYCDYLLLEKIQVKHIWGVRQQMSERNLCGQRYGRLTALRQADKPQNCKTKSDYWLCRCDCGNEVVVLGSNLVRGHTKSCGCLKQNDLTGKHIGKRPFSVVQTSMQAEGNVVFACGNAAATAAISPIRRRIH